jgi:competence protein ComEA
VNINLNRAWLYTALGLVAVAAAGGAVLGVRLHQSPLTEISLASDLPSTSPAGVYIEGAVVRPGFYPTTDNTTLSSLLGQSGLETGADAGALRLVVPAAGDNATAQRIDLNRAEPWLLAALPGIGDVRARAIFEYRAVHGPFRWLDDLLNVPGINPSLLDRLRPYITLG